MSFTQFFTYSNFLAKINFFAPIKTLDRLLYWSSAEKFTQHSEAIVHKNTVFWYPTKYFIAIRKNMITYIFLYNDI